MHDLQIMRKANHSDINSIFGIEKDVFKEENWSYNMIHSSISDITTTTYVIEELENIVAYCMVKITENEFEIINFVVAPLFQRKGRGELILDFFLKQIPINSSVFLEVKKSNAAAINLYNSTGFQIINIQYNYYKDGSDAFVMRFNK
tara:strand:+ start:2244 stop:2684 length:441 start_codon:yes stop_codon:yes gene_type:complete